ncbi:GAF domain-containing protein [Anaerolineales bacterium HSG25]|nr:GAF domain-containing protein [Anaerolineales bacterium HSG25]
MKQTSIDNVILFAISYIQQLQRWLTWIVSLVWMGLIVLLGLSISANSQPISPPMIAGMLLIIGFGMWGISRGLGRYFNQALADFNIALEVFNDSNQLVPEQPEELPKEDTPPPIQRERIKTPPASKFGPMASRGPQDMVWDADNIDEVRSIFNQLFQTDFEAVIVHSKFRIIAVNEALAELFGHEEAAFNELTILDLAISEVHNAILKNILLKYDQSYEIVGLHKDSSTMPLRVLSRTLLYGGRAIRVMGFQETSTGNTDQIVKVLKASASYKERSPRQGTTELRFANEQLRQELYSREQLAAELKSRAAQQAAVAAVGQIALGKTSLSNLMNDAAELVAQTLNVEYAKIVEVIPSAKDVLLLRAGFGWQENSVGRVTIQSTTDSQSGYTLLTHESIVVEDMHLEKRFYFSDLLIEHQVKAGITVVIEGREGAFGVLGAHTSEMRHFTTDDVHFMQSMANVLAATIERKQNENEILRRNQELMILQFVGTIIISSKDIRQSLPIIAKEILRLLDVEACVIYEWNLTEQKANLLAHQHPQEWNVSTNPTASINLLDYHQAKLVLTNQRAEQVIHSQSHSEAEFARLPYTQLKTLLMLPMIFQERVWGMIDLIDSRVERIFTGQEIAVAQLVANQIATALDSVHLYEEIHQYLEELTTLNMISQTITSTLDLNKTLTVVTEHVIRLSRVAAASVALYDRQAGTLWFAASSGQSKAYLQDAKLQQGQGIVGWVIQHEEPLLVPDVSNDPRFFGRFDEESGFQTQSILCVPLQTKGQTIGAIEAINKDGSPFDQEDLRVLTSLAAPAATAIENAQLFERAQQEIVERRRAETALEKERALLAQRVAERTADLQTANAELARAARLKDEFLANMSHELRTPLTAILGMCEVLNINVYGELNDRQVKSVNSIETSGRHLLSLINDILDLSKIEAGKLEIDIGPVSVRRVCESSLQFVKQMANKKEITVSFDVSPDIPTIHVDERRLKQILVNLLSNAVKFTPKFGKVGLEATISATNQINFTVWDTGVGIPREEMGQLFKPFTQLDSSLSRHYTGTGLGLALVSRMVRMHNGQVSVESEVGKGSRFTVSFPYSHKPTNEIPQLPSISSVQPSPPPQAKPSAPQKSNDIPLILVTEDEDSVSDLFKEYLQAVGYQVSIANNGLEAIDKAKAEQPDLILMDIQMPKMNGLEATRQLRASSTMSHIPIIALTARAMAGDKEKCLEAGANDYLSKPVNLKLLAETVAAQLSRVKE